MPGEHSDRELVERLRACMTAVLHERGLGVQCRPHANALVDAISPIIHEALSNTPAQVPCPNCGGAGWTVGAEAVCCGNYLRSGECCSQPVQGQTQEGCDCCQGSGCIDATPTQGEAVALREAAQAFLDGADDGFISVDVGLALRTALSQAPAPVEQDEDFEPPCDVPPEGWWCSRKAGHEGPCAARQLEKPWEGPLTDKEQAAIDQSWEKYKAAAPVDMGVLRERVARAIWTAPITGQPEGGEVRQWPPRDRDALTETYRQADAALTALKSGGGAE
jgi:hypothetical protein